MKWINGSYSIFISLFVLFSISANPSNPEKKGDSLVQLERYREALIFYERQIFDSREKPVITRLLLKKAQCLKLTGMYAEALDELKRASYAGFSDSLSFEVLYESALCAWLSSQFDEAAARIKMLQHFVKDTVMVKRSLLLETLILAEQLKWEESHAKAVVYIQSLQIPEREQEKMLLALEKQFQSPPKLKKENTGRWLNYLVPGSGQVYAGYPAGGIMSFALNATSLAFGVLMIINGYYLTGYIIGTGLLQKFYFGGLRRTEYLVQKTNYLRIRKFNDEIKEILMTDVKIE